jgi:hypothetical protein
MRMSAKRVIFLPPSKKMAEMMRSCCPGEGKMADCCSMMRKMMQGCEEEESIKKKKEN